MKSQFPSLWKKDHKEKCETKKVLEETLTAITISSLELYDIFTIARCHRFVKYYEWALMPQC